jgi:hypothetical protein
MPEERQAPVIPEANLEAEPLKVGLQAIAEDYALSVVKQTFWNYERFRQQNHDNRWATHDALYFGWVPQKVWEGTNIPRSSLGMPITFGQIETSYPKIVQSLFRGADWFDVTPEPGGSAQEAHGIQSHLLYSLEHVPKNYSNNGKTEIALATRQILLHGNGGIAIEYDPVAGHPVVEWVDLRDFYVDSACSVPSIDAARSIIRRKIMTLDALEELRSDKRMKIPDKAVLAHMARNGALATFGDRTKQISEAYRGVQYNPNQERWSPVPNERNIEVLIYYSKYRIIWVLNREWVAYNEPNPYGFIPFCFAPCFPVIGRFYAMSFADILESKQRYIEALLNGHLDEVSLAIAPPRVRKRGSVLTPAQQRWHPGNIQEADDPAKDVNVLYPQRITQGVMEDVAFIEASAEKLTGANSVIQGVPKPGNANRSATGMSLQNAGGTSRLWTIVKNIEDYLIVPMLYKMYRMTQMHTIPGQLLPALGKEGQVVQVGADAFRAPCRFRMSAASEMLTQEKLSQIVPFISQYIMAGPFIQALQGQGQTVDFTVFSQMIQDATGTGEKYNLFRPMNEQEQQARQTPPPQAVMQQQMKQADAQTRLALMDKKVAGELQKTQIQKQPDPQQAQAEMMRMFAKAQAEREKAQLETQKAQQKIVAERLAAQQKLEHESASMKLKLFGEAARGKQQMEAQQQQHQLSLLQQAQQHQHQMAVSGAQTQQQLQHGAEAGKQKLSQQADLTKHKMAMDKQKLALQARVLQLKNRFKPAAPKKVA